MEDTFRSGGYPRKFSCQKNFRALVVTGGGCHKEIIIQGRQIKRRFSCGRPVIPEKKRRCNGRVYTCVQAEKWYVPTEGQTVYLRYQTNRTPSLDNPPIQTTLPRTPFTAPLHTPDLNLSPMPLYDSSRPNKKDHYTPNLLPYAIYVASGNSGSTLTNPSDPPQDSVLTSYAPSTGHTTMRDKPGCPMDKIGY